MMPPATPLYLDHAATTPVREEVAAAMEEARGDAFANPSSPHAAGRRAKARLEDCRERILRLLDAVPARGDRLVFTSGATEANRMAVLGLAAPGPGSVAHSGRDHGSIGAAAAARAGGTGPNAWTSVPIPLTSGGTLDLEAARRLVAASTGQGLLCTTLVCGQTGIVEDLPGVAALAAAVPALWVHVDATQAVGLGPGGWERMPVATMTLAPHKFGGPRGIGGLVVRGGVPLAAVTAGTQEGGLRGGTEPVSLAVGFATALELAAAERQAEAARLAALRERFERELARAAAGGGVTTHVIGGHVARAPHITTIAFSTAAGRALDRQAIVMGADLEGVCAATGTACASGSSEPAAALVAMGLPEGIVQSAVRFSFGRDTSLDAIAEAIARLRRVLARMADPAWV